MNKDVIKEKIKFYTEITKMLITVIIVLTGGLTALLINTDSILKAVLFTGGVVLEIIVILLLKDFNKEIFCLFRNLEDK